MDIIDPHLHLFDLNKGDYHWLKASNPPFWPDKPLIAKNCSVDDISLSAPFSLKGFVHIEAGFNNEQPWQEIAWLSSLTTPSTINYTAVAFIDITAEDEVFNHQLQHLLAFSSVVGCRYILDDNACDVLQQPQVAKNLATLAEHQLSFDVQMPLDNISAVNALMKILSLLPNLQFIINHCGFPPSTNHTAHTLVAEIEVKAIESEQNNRDISQLIHLQNWQQAITLLSRFENCAIKCSGWEMTDRQYRKEWLSQVLTHCFSCFGQQRVMLASNFPLTLFSKSYQDYWQSILAVCEQVLTYNETLTTSAKNSYLADISSNNASIFYKLTK